MAHAKTSNPQAQWSREIERGIRGRRIDGLSFLTANARTNMTDPNSAVADNILGETSIIGIFSAPCNSRVLGIKYAARTAPHLIDQGTSTVQVLKNGAVSLSIAAVPVQTNELLAFYTYNTTGLAWTDDTVDVNDAGGTDVPLFDANPEIGDAIYIGSTNRFNGFIINIATAGLTGVFTGVWEYWTGAAWKALSGITDETYAFLGNTYTTANGRTLPAGFYRVYWPTTLLPTWTAADPGSGVVGYYVRFRLTAWTSQVQKPVAHQIKLFPQTNYWGDFQQGEAVDIPLSTTAGALQLAEGDIVYAQVVTSAIGAGDVVTRGEAQRIEVEWMPQEV